METARREMSIAGYPTIKDHNAFLGTASSSPLPRLSHPDSERVEEGWKQGHEQRGDPDLLLI